MVTNIDRRELLQLLDEDDVQIVDVLPEREFEETHIPGAVNIPLKRLTAATASALHRDKPVAVY